MDQGPNKTLYSSGMLSSMTGEYLQKHIYKIDIFPIVSSSQIQTSSTLYKTQ